MTNNNLQDTTQKTKDRATRTRQDSHKTACVDGTYIVIIIIIIICIDSNLTQQFEYIVDIYDTRYYAQCMFLLLCTNFFLSTQGPGWLNELGSWIT